jgi:hypothetical protein
MVSDAFIVYKLDCIVQKGKAVKWLFPYKIFFLANNVANHFKSRYCFSIMDDLIFQRKRRSYLWKNLDNKICHNTTDNISFPFPLRGKKRVVPNVEKSSTVEIVLIERPGFN